MLVVLVASAAAATRLLVGSFVPGLMAALILLPLAIPYPWEFKNGEK